MPLALRSALLATTAALASACCVSAAHAQAWELPVTTLSPHMDGTTDVSVALEDDGDGIAVWGSRPDDGLPGQNIWTSTRPAGGRWQSRSLVWGGAYAVDPVIASDPDGNAVTAWLGDAVDLEENVHVASRSGATGAWSDVTDFEAAGADQFEPDVAINARGDAVVTWIELGEGGADFYVRASTRTGGVWSAPVTLNASDYSASLQPAQVELDAGGNARVLWVARDTTESTSHVQESRFDGSTWSPPHNVVSSLDYIFGLEVSGDGAGRVVAAWTLGFGETIQAGNFSDGAWAIGDVTDDVEQNCSPDTAVSAGANGTATVAWLTRSTGGVATASGAGGAWGAAEPVYNPPQGNYVGRVTLGQVPGREPVVVWTTSSDDELFGAMGSRRTGAGWQQPTPLAVAGGRGFSRPSVAMNASGDALAGWSVYQSYWAKVQVTGSAASPAQTPALSPPATSGDGRPLNPPFVKVRGGVFRVPRTGRVLRARLVNRESIPLRGVARLVHFYGRAHKSGPPMRRVASQRRVRVKVDGRSMLRLRLNDEAMRRLRTAPRHAYPVRLYLRLRAPDGRRVKTTITFTLDAWKRFGHGHRPPVARASC
ncbi:MAG: hypothetical protein QOE69_1654 [Thermoleophilaceae bacterium]|jgi:hypothetical protein|nr:hypothetical protein [Thermoleophilaceae bacterium]